ncbi:RluA family pseudouridine synthase [Paenibacillus wynnii]|uniref:RluA family pseudouridine synthase n=1 Tax=Paenibacillus wynnii TaxID=268407 RepID=UPI002793D786|nr:RluA family pseudouridine synthase [Paenibacillus wynnii]MDQ0192556.1 23S rRNA pseudouridine1911/1915/1917 synthase [Paenibacillus wynnii]
MNNLDKDVNHPKASDYEEEKDVTEWTVTAEHARERVDKYITESWEGNISRSQVQLWINDGHVNVNGAPVKANHKLLEGEVVTVVVPETEVTDLVAENIPLEVVYEDSDVIVINKKRGMVVHPAVGHPSGTLVNALMYHCKDLSGINGEIRPGIVHRIDKDTSGLIMAAKNDASHASLSAQLKEHSVTRRYIAIVQGNITHDKGTVDAPIGRDPHDRKLYVVTQKNSKKSVTHFTVIERFGDCTLVELQLETGRTHQIRVHMKFIGHPLAGDPIYGRSKGTTMTGQALHAAVLGFVHPSSGEYMEFSAPLPADMEDLLFTLRSR